MVKLLSTCLDKIVVITLFELVHGFSFDHHHFGFDLSQVGEEYFCNQFSADAGAVTKKVHPVFFADE